MTLRPKTTVNNFGLFVGGPVSFPGVYKDTDKTFFFLVAEGLRLPKEQTVVCNVPSVALRNGDLSVSSTQIKYPNTGLAFPNNQIPSDRIAPISKNVYGLTAAHNFVTSPTLLNEARGGFTERHTGTTYGLTSAQAVTELGLVGIPQPYSKGANAPNYDQATKFPEERSI